MKKKIEAFGAPLLTLMLAACASTPASGPSADLRTEDYAPLGVGASYTYKMNQLGQIGEMVVTLTGIEDGYVVDDRRGALMHTREGLRDRQRYLIRYPIQAGTKWKAVVGPSSVESYQIISVGESCTSAAGHFGDCLVVEASAPHDANVTLRIRWTWAKGIGLAKLETMADVKGKGLIPQTSQSLKNYILKAEDAPKWEQ